MSALIFKEEAYAIIGAAMEVYNELGPGFLEAVYQEAMEIELRRRGVPFVAQQRIPIYYKEELLTKTYIADLLAYEKIIIEIKAEDQLQGRDQSQVINYLNASRLRLGLLFNFGSVHEFQFKRLLSRFSS